MINTEPLPFIKAFLNSLQVSLGDHHRLSKCQCLWIGFCLMGILMTNSIAWAKFERVSLKEYTKQALSKMFKYSKINWNKLLECSVRMILKKYGITNGTLVVDDKDHARSKNAEHLHGLHKIKDKTTGGYILGQNIVVLHLVTEKFCIPVSFAFYIPDPSLSAWYKENQKLKKQGVPKKMRPKEPKRSKDNPKKYEIALKLLRQFANGLPEIKINCILADALYGNGVFIDEIEKIWPGVQVITQIRANQKIRFRNKDIACKKYFESYQGWGHAVSIRGQKEINVTAGGARVYVCSQNKKRFVIALKYEGETEYRYLIASNLTWNIKEIIQAYTLRWYIEVFFEDWSGYCGFCSMAKQCGVDGSERPLILSLLFDHCFLFHFRQQIFVENKLPLATLGSLVEKSRFDALCQFIKCIVHSQDPKQYIRHLEDISDEIFPFKSSRKHLSGLNGQMGSKKKIAA
jgi:DDE superfamily endonuclease